jgi:hypothetical protein
MVLRRQGPSLFRDDFTTATLATVDARMIRRVAWPILFIERGIVALGNI